MDVAIVTGASSSLGISISKRLIQMGFRIYGLGGDYKDCPINNVDFIPISCDLTDLNTVEAKVNSILEKEGGVYALIHNAKTFPRKPYLHMTAEEMSRTLDINLLFPLYLTKLLLPSLQKLQGYVIQLGASSAETSAGSVLGAASAGGVRWMGEALFQEMREYGIKSCHISPEPNRIRSREVSKSGMLRESTIDPEAVSNAVAQIISSGNGNIITELVLRPQRIEEQLLESVVRLPFPDAKPIPYTVPKELIEAEEALEEQEIERKSRERRKRRGQRGESGKPSSKNQNRGQDDKRASDKPPAETPANSQKEKTESANTVPRSGEDGTGKKKKRRKPKPPAQVVGFGPALEKQEMKSEESGKRIERHAASSTEREKQPAKKASKKRPASRKKTKTNLTSEPKKAASKRTAARKAAKKEPKKQATKKAVKKAAKKAVKKATKKVAKKRFRKSGSGKGEEAGSNGKESA